MTPADHFDKITEDLTKKPNVTLGKMMSAPGLKYKNKVFAFFFKEEMGFKLGDEQILKDLGVVEYGPLSPFKTKPPLKGWYVVSPNEGEHWDTLTEKAQYFMREQLG